MNKKLTPEQIESWRTVLCGMIGPYALIMPVEHIVALKDKMQERINNEFKADSQGFHCSKCGSNNSETCRCNEAQEPELKPFTRSISDIINK